MKFATRIAIVVALFAMTLAAADMSGKWAGTLSGDQNNSDSALLILQQDGTKLTGTAGSDENDRHPIQNGTVQEDSVKFEVQLQDRVLVADLTVKGDEMSGKVEMKRNGQTVRTGRLSLKRAK